MSHRSSDRIDHRMLAMSRHALSALRTALLRDAGSAGASALQEAGYAGGESVFAAFSDWLASRGHAHPDALSVSDFERLAAEFFRDNGWGTLELGTLHDVVATVESRDWQESDPRAALDHPGCHFTTGLLADFFGRVSDEPLAILEVECRSMGHDRCRFLLGSGEVMTEVFEALERGDAYDSAVQQAARQVA